jgi:centromere protein C
LPSTLADIACTSSQIHVRSAHNSTFAFEKVFGVDEFMAAGVLHIEVGGQKPVKPSKDNNYVSSTTF